MIVAIALFAFFVLFAVYIKADIDEQVRQANALSEDEWDAQYDEAVQRRDWQTCDYLIEERERCAWYEPESFGVGETSCGDAATNRTIADAGDPWGSAA